MLKTTYNFNNIFNSNSNHRNYSNTSSNRRNNNNSTNIMISSCSSNTKHSKGNTSTDFGIQTSPSSSSINNIKVFYNELTKHLKKKKKDDKVNTEEKKQTSTNGTSSSNNTNTTVRERKNIKKKEGKYCGIDTPEELHFFYVNVIQNGKALENNF